MATTPAQIKNSLAAIVKEAGPRAYADVTVSVSDYPTAMVSAVLYPEGVGGRVHSIRVSGESFSEALTKLRAAWDAGKDKAQAILLRKMALAVIEISTDIGACTDAALRGRDFSQDQIDRFGALACEEATRLAAGGPFSIVTSKGANAPHEMEAA